MRALIEWIGVNWAEHGSLMQSIVWSGGVLIAILLIRSYLYRKLNKTGIEIKEQYNKKKGINVVFIIIYIISLLMIWYDRSQYIITFIGFFSAGLAIMMKDILINIVGGLYILWAKPFKIGDRIEINGNIGDVIDIGCFQFKMLEVGNRISGEQSTGRMTQVPNMQLFYSPIYNYEKGFRYIWHEISIDITLESDWEKTKEILYRIIEETTEEVIEQARGEIEHAGNKYFIYYSNLTPIIYTEVKNGYIRLTARYLCNPRQTRMTEHMLWESFLKVIQLEEHINLKKV